MISEEKLEELREILNSAENPLFLFDNDLDGMMSFLLLFRYIKRGKGVVIKSSPALDESYTRKIYETKPDYIFVLDKPLIEKEFIEEAKKFLIPLIWIDHHPLQKLQYIKYFNPFLSKKPTNEPTSYWCYKTTRKKEDVWIATMGCIADWHIPDFVDEFNKLYKEFEIKTKNPGEILYKTELGKIIKLLSFAMKDRTTVVSKMLKFLCNIKTMRELLEENKNTERMYKRFRQINRLYKKLLEKALEEAKKFSNNLIFFKYSAQLAISGELSNELFYLFQKKNIAVAHIKNNVTKVSLRGKNIRSITEKAMEGIEGKYGGHENACASTFSTQDLGKFYENLKNLVK